MSNEVDVVTLGSVVLEDFEVMESITFGRVREIAVNKVAGGIVVIQDFGDFPPDAIIIRGTLYGAGCEDRSFQIEQLCKMGRVLPLTWRQWKYTGIVKRYSPGPKHFTDIPYELEFVPMTNDSTGASDAPPVDPPKLIKYSMAQVAKSINNPPSGISFSDDIQKVFKGLQDAVSQGQKDGLSNLPDVDKQQIADAADKISKALEGAKNSSDSLIASTAGNLINYLNIVKKQISTLGPTIFEVPVSNPNLPQLAAQYYGDHTKWELIAKANNLGVNTNPKGDFILKIPFTSTEPEKKGIIV